MLRSSGLLTLGAAVAALTSLHQPAAAQQPRTANDLSCIGAVLHFTARGFAFECVEQNGNARFLLVVRDDNFNGRRDHVIDILRELNGRSSSGTARMRAGKGMWVSYRRPDGAAQSVCASVRTRYSDAKCMIAGDIAFR